MEITEVQSNSSVETNQEKQIWKLIKVNSFLPITIPVLFFISVSILSFLIIFTNENFQYSILLLALIFLFLIFRLYSTLLSRGLFTNRIITIDHFPHPNNFESLKIIAQTHLQLEKHINSIDGNFNKKIYSWLLLSILYNLTHMTYIILNYPITEDIVILYFLGVLTINLGIDLILLRITSTSHIILRQDSFTQWRKAVLNLREISEEDWLLHIDGYVNSKANNKEQLQLVKKYKSLIPLEPHSNGLTYLDIKNYVESFPDTQILNEAIDKGFKEHFTYMKSIESGAPTLLEYNKMIKSGFLNYPQYHNSNNLSYPDYDSYYKGTNANCENFEQFKLLNSRGFTLSTFDELKKAESQGFLDYSSYVDAIERGFTHRTIWVVANANGIPNMDEFTAMAKFGIIVDDETLTLVSTDNLYSIYVNAINSNFSTYSDYLQAKSNGIDRYEEFELIQKKGFKSKAEFLEAKSNGFENSEVKNKVTVLGFKNINQYDLALDKGCENNEQYEDLIASGYDNWENYLEGKKGNFKSFSEFQIANKMGVSDRETLTILKNTGFENYNQYKDSISSGFLTKEHYEEAKLRGIPKAEIMDEMDELGFKLYETYTQAKEKGFATPEELKEANLKGAPNKKAFHEMKALKFEYYEDYQIAQELNFPDFGTYEDSKQIGAKNFNEYLILQRENLTRAEFIQQTEYEISDRNQLIKTLEESYEESIKSLEKRKKRFYCFKIRSSNY